MDRDNDQTRRTRRPQHLSGALTASARTLNVTPTPPNLTPLSLRFSARTLPDECRAKCALCHGAGRPNCSLCEGFAFVCPTCRGMKWLRTGQIEGGTYTIERCDRCLTPTLRLEAVSRYLERWIRQHPQEASSHE